MKQSSLDSPPEIYTVRVRLGDSVEPSFKPGPSMGSVMIRGALGVPPAGLCCGIRKERVDDAFDLGEAEFYAFRIVTDTPASEESTQGVIFTHHTISGLHMPFVKVWKDPGIVMHGDVARNRTRTCHHAVCHLVDAWTSLPGKSATAPSMWGKVGL